MMIWVLLVYSSYGIVTIDFASHELCEQAKNILIKQSWVARSSVMCLPRGEFK